MLYLLKTVCLWLRSSVVSASIFKTYDVELIDRTEYAYKHLMKINFFSISYVQLNI